MIHDPITLEQFMEAYIKAHYFRPDGEDRNWEEYGLSEDNKKLLLLAKASPIKVKSFSFAYFRGLTKFPLLDLKTTVTFDLPYEEINISKAIRWLDLSMGECPPLMQPVRQLNGDLSFIITERY